MYIIHEVITLKWETMTFSVVFIHGPASAGKYTIGSLVGEKLGIPLFHNHLTVDLVKTLFEFGTEGFKNLRAAVWRESFKAACDAKQSFVFTFHPENSVDPSLMDELASLVRNAGGVVQYVELTCSDDAIAQRIGGGSRKKFGKLTDAAIYRDLKEIGAFEFPPFPAPLVTIDTESLAAEIAAERIVEALTP